VQAMEKETLRLDCEKLVVTTCTAKIRISFILDSISLFLNKSVSLLKKYAVLRIAFS